MPALDSARMPLFAPNPHSRPQEPLRRVPFVLLSVLQALRDWFLPKPSRLRERRKGVYRFPGMGAAMEPPSARPRQVYLKGGAHQRGRKAQGLRVQRPKAARGESHCESGLGREVFRKCINVPAVPPVPEAPRTPPAAVGEEAGGGLSAGKARGPGSQKALLFTLLWPQEGV